MAQVIGRGATAYSSLTDQEKQRENALLKLFAAELKSLAIKDSITESIISQTATVQTYASVLAENVLAAKELSDVQVLLAATAAQTKLSMKELTMEQAGSGEGAKIAKEQFAALATQLVETRAQQEAMSIAAQKQAEGGQREVALDKQYRDLVTAQLAAAETTNEFTARMLEQQAAAMTGREVFMEYLEATGRFSAEQLQTASQTALIKMKIEELNDALTPTQATVSALSATLEGLNTKLAEQEALLTDLEGLGVTGESYDRVATSVTSLKEKISQLNASIAPGAEQSKKMATDVAALQVELEKLTESTLTTSKAQKEATKTATTLIKTKSDLSVKLTDLAKTAGPFPIVFGRAAASQSEAAQAALKLIAAESELQKEFEALIEKTGEFTLNIDRATFAKKEFGSVLEANYQKFRAFGFLFDRVGFRGAVSFIEIARQAGLAGVAIAAVSLGVLALIGKLVKLAAAGANAFKELIKNAVETAKIFDTLKAGFTAVFDGGAKGLMAAEATIARLDKFALKYGIDIAEISRAFLPEVSSLDQLEEVLKLTTALARFQPEQGVQGARIALQNAISGDMRSLVRRFELKQSVGLDIAALQDEFGEVEGLIRGLGAELERAGRDVEAVSDTYETWLGRATELIEILKRKMGEPILESLKEGLRSLVTLFVDLDTGDLTDTGRKLEASFKAVGVTVSKIIDDLRESINLLDEGGIDSLYKATLAMAASFQQISTELSKAGTTLDLLGKISNRVFYAMIGINILVAAGIQQLNRDLETLKENWKYFTSGSFMLPGPLRKHDATSFDEMIVESIFGFILAVKEGQAEAAQAMKDLYETLGEPPDHSMGERLADYDRTVKALLDRIDDEQILIAELEEKMQKERLKQNEFGMRDLLTLQRRMDLKSIEQAIENGEDRLKIERDFIKELQKIRTQFEGIVDEETLNKALKQQLDYHRKILDMAEDDQRKRQDINRKDKQKREDIQEKGEQDEADIYKKHARKMADLEEEIAKKREDAERKHLDRLKDIKRRFEFDSLEAIRNNDAIRYLQIQRRMKFDLAQEEERRKREIEDAVNDEKDKREKLKKELDRSLEDLFENLERRYADQKKAYDRELKEQALNEERKREDLKKWLDRQQEDFASWWEERLRKDKEGWDEMQKNWQQAVNRLNDMLRQLQQARMTLMSGGFGGAFSGGSFNPNPFPFPIPQGPIGPDGPPGVPGSPGAPGSSGINSVSTDELRRIAHSLLMRPGHNNPTNPSFIPAMKRQAVIRLIRDLEQALGIPLGSSVPIPRAKGGPFKAGQTLLVGERGPEIVKFDRGGNVIPNHNLFSLPSMAAGGGSYDNRRIQNIDLSLLDPSHFSPIQVSKIESIVKNILLSAI